jgi:PAS domain S-box-containing protein
MAVKKKPTKKGSVAATGAAKKTATRSSGPGKLHRQKAADRGRSDAALRDGEDLYRNIFRDAVLGIFHSTLDGGFIDVNPALARMMGYDSPEQVLSSITSIAEQVYADPPKRDAVVRQALEAGGTITAENRYLRKDGAIWHGLLHLRIVKDKKGQPDHYEGFIEDITERKRAEEEVEMLKHSIDVHYDGAYWIDSDNKFVYVNDAGCKALGYTREELIGKTIYEVNSKVTVERMKEVWAGYQQGRSFSVESMHRRKDGSEFPVEVVNTYVRFGGKKYICGFARDITERKKAEGALLDSETRYRTLFEQSGDSILVMKIGKDSIPVITDMNETALRAHGYSREEMAGQPISFLDPVADVGVNDGKIKTLKNGNFAFFTTQHRQKDGSLIDVEVRARLISIGGEQIIVSTERDITGRKRAEETLRESENRTRSIIEAIPVGMHMYRLEPDGRLVFIGANPAADRILGVDNSIFIGKTIEEAFPPLKETGVPQRYREVAASGKTWREENIDYHEGVIQGAFEVHAFRTAPNNMVAAFEDITERKRVEKALRESEQRIYETLEFNKSILNTSSIGILTYNAAGQCVFANEATADIVGTNVAGLLAQNFHQLQSWKKSGMYEAAQRALNTGIEQQMETHVVTTFRKDVWISLRFSSFHSHGEKHLLVFTYDITERKRAEEALGASQKLLETIIDAAPT